MKKLTTLFVCLFALSSVAQFPPILRNYFTTNASPYTNNTFFDATFKSSSNNLFRAFPQSLNRAGETNAYFSITNGSFQGSIADVFDTPSQGWVDNQMPKPGLIISSFLSVLCDISDNWATNAIIETVQSGLRDAGWRTIFFEDGMFQPTYKANGDLQINSNRFPRGIEWYIAYARSNNLLTAGYLTASTGASCCSTQNPGSPPELFAQHTRQTLNWGFNGMLIDMCVVDVSVDTADRARHYARVWNTVAFDTYTAGTNRGMFLLMNQNDSVNDLIDRETADSVNVLGIVPLGSTAALNTTANILSSTRRGFNYSWAVRRGHSLSFNGFNPLSYGGGGSGDTLKQILTAGTMTCCTLQIGRVGTTYNSADYQINLNVLTNSEWLAIHQDASVIMGRQAYSNALNEVWVRPILNTNIALPVGTGVSGTNAVALWNANTSTQSIAVTTAMLGIRTNAHYKIHDVWNRVDLTNDQGNFTLSVPPTNCLLLTVSVLTEGATMPSFTTTPEPQNAMALSTLFWSSNGNIFSSQADQYSRRWLNQDLLLTAPVIFEPNQVGGMAIRYDISALNYPVGTTVATFPDTAGNNYHAIVAPNLVGPKFTNDTTLSRGFARFNGFNTGMATNIPVNWNTTNSFFMVIRQQATNGAIFASATPVDTVFYDTSVPNGLFVNAGSQFSFLTPTNAWRIIEVVFAGANSYVKTNGQVAASGNAGTTSFQFLNIGCNSAQAQEASMDLAYFMVYTNGLTGAQETNITRWLNEYYGGIYTDANNTATTSVLTHNLTRFGSLTTIGSNGVAPTSITFPATTVNWTNPEPYNIELYIDNTAVTGTVFKKNGTQIFGGLSADVVIGLQTNEYFSETYTVGTPSARYSPR